jgi:hypothetical protein
MSAAPGSPGLSRVDMPQIRDLGFLVREPGAVRWGLQVVPRTRQQG